jgi:hypothetical protein
MDQCTLANVSKLERDAQTLAFGVSVSRLNRMLAFDNNTIVKLSSPLPQSSTSTYDLQICRVQCGAQVQLDFILSFHVLIH